MAMKTSASLAVAPVLFGSGVHGNDEARVVQGNMRHSAGMD
jgi:hypothetical protein